MTRGADRLVDERHALLDPAASALSPRATDGTPGRRLPEGSIRATVIEFRWRSGTRVQPVLYIGWSYLH